MYVLDTNTLIYFFKGIGNVDQKLLSISPKEIGIPTIVIYELEVGIAKSKAPRNRQKQLEEIISLANVLPFTAKEAKTCSTVRKVLLEPTRKAPLRPQGGSLRNRIRLDTLQADRLYEKLQELEQRKTVSLERLQQLRKNWELVNQEIRKNLSVFVFRKPEKIIVGQDSCKSSPAEKCVFGQNKNGELQGTCLFCHTKHF